MKGKGTFARPASQSYGKRQLGDAGILELIGVEILQYAGATLRKFSRDQISQNRMSSTQGTCGVLDLDCSGGRDATRGFVLTGLVSDAFSEQTELLVFPLVWHPRVSGILCSRPACLGLLRACELVSCCSVVHFCSITTLRSPCLRSRRAFRVRLVSLVTTTIFIREFPLRQRIVFSVLHLKMHWATV